MTYPQLCQLGWLYCAAWVRCRACSLECWCWCGAGTALQNLLPRANSLICLRCWWAGKGHCIFTLPVQPQDKWVLETALSCSALWGWLTQTSNNGVSSIVLFCWVAGNIFPSATAGKREGQLLCPPQMIEARGHFPSPPTTWQKRGNMAFYPTPTQGYMTSPLPTVTSSTVLSMGGTGPTFLTATDDKWVRVWWAPLSFTGGERQSVRRSISPLPMADAKLHSQYLPFLVSPSLE